MLIMVIYIIIAGGRSNLFKHEFGIRKREMMLKASQCYFRSSAGLIAGVLFISTEKVAFCDELVRKHQVIFVITVPLKLFFKNFDPTVALYLIKLGFFSW